MGAANSTSSSSSPSAADPVAPKKKICCACPETKGPRDECIAMKGEENCTALIEAHKKCLRAEGFDV
eukprot:CAMPEP_0114255066 /NCGR_PEP_ID=MMETSP0058-20121206/17349_1 /TAXON_ID=36894 /ORGANISM="Pyramimonas parkeae, CCMP726" /LENGTH=66 /DNA_ID=CAMNT_0001369397 /DNA_START=88 /DNA_END=288 /DNA_ORIENTATION=+